MQPIRDFRMVRGVKAALAGALMLGVAGCGFHPAGSIGHLPAAMQHTYIQSNEPYGHLENLLRNALRARGEQVSTAHGATDAVLDIVNHSTRSRVLAVNARGQPLQYQLVYRVEFRLLDRTGKELLAPTILKVQRQLAYSVTNELGTGSRRRSLVGNMQREASRLILLRLEALDRRHLQ